jgi:hypothetical protein
MTQLSHLSALNFFILLPNHSSSYTSVGFFDWRNIAFTLIFTLYGDRYPAQLSLYSHFRYWIGLSFHRHLSLFDNYLQLSTLRRELLVRQTLSCLFLEGDPAE